MKTRTYLLQPCSHLSAESLMRHAVKDVIEPYTEGHRCEGLGIIRIVRPLPCVAQMHVMADGDDDAALIIADSSPLWLIAVLLVSASGANPLFAGNLHLVIDIVECMEDLVATPKVFDRTVRQHLPHAVHEVFPILGAVKVIHHQKASLKQVLAQPLCFRVSKGPHLNL